MSAFSTFVHVSVTAALATTGIIPYGDFVFGFFTVESASATTLTWYASADGTNYQAAQDDDGAIVQTIAASKAYKIPDELAGARYLKAVGDDVCSLIVSFKG